MKLRPLFYVLILVPGLKEKQLIVGGGDAFPIVDHWREQEPTKP